MASCRSKIRCCFSITAAQRKQGEPFFLPWPFLSSLLSCSWFSRCNEKQSSNEGRRRKDYMRSRGLMLIPLSFFYSDSFQDCFTWATQFPTEPFTHGWKAWWERNKWLVELLCLQLRLWLCMVLGRGQVAEGRDCMYHMARSLHVITSWKERSAQILDVKTTWRLVSSHVCSIVFNFSSNY